MNDDDLRALLDSAIGDGPEPPPPAEHLVPARRALRRRRATSGGLVAATLAVVATVAVVAGPGGSTRALDPATTPTATPTATPTPPAAPCPVDRPVERGTTQELDDLTLTYDPDTGTLQSAEPGCAPGEVTVPSTPAPRRPADGADVELADDGTLLTGTGVRVLERIANPLGYEPPDHSLAIAYTRGGKETWALLDLVVDGTGGYAGVSSDPARKAYATLAQWTDSQVALHDGGSGPATDFVTFAGAGERLRPEPGVEILDQTGDVGPLADFAGPGDPTAAAMVRLVATGERWFVLARRIGGSPAEYIPTAGSVGGPDLASFLAYAQTQYAGGEGLR